MSSGRGSRGGRGRGGISDFFSFTNTELPSVVAPMGASSRANYPDWDDGANSNSPPASEQGQAESTQRRSGLDYVQQYLEEERIKISKIKLGSSKEKEETGRGRGRRFDTNRGHNGFHRTRVRNFRREESEEASIYGTIPDRQVMDTEVFLKYDFDQRVFDTKGLVINRVKQKILSLLSCHQVVTIEGFTGCGKTTQVPQFILDEAVNNRTNCRIAVTQPRRIAAISVANRVASERNWRIGGIVGYQVGMDKQITEDTRLTYMTTGVLLQLLINKKSLMGWTHIIIDEVHERDLDTDLLLLVIKKIMVDTANDTTRVILMSATLNPDKFTDYFPLWENKHFTGSSVNIKVDLPNQYPIAEYYLEEAAAFGGYDNYSMDNFEEAKIYQESYEIATKIIEGLDMLETSSLEKDGIRIPPSDFRGAVLVFLPGLQEIETLYKILTDASVARRGSDERKLNWSVLPLHSTITNEEQQRVFIPAKNKFRKIILATNIAESSITVPDIKYVIDFCLTKNLSCDPSTNYTCLRLEWASKNQCTQRRGRCGRVGPGIVYRMVSRKFYDTLEQEARPEMMRSSLESVVLKVKLLEMGSPKSILALSVDPPDESNIKRAVSNLKEIGAMTIQVGGNYDAYDGDLTFVGRVLSGLPIDIRFGRLILLGHAFDCLEETVVIAAGLSVKSPFAYPYARRLDAYLSKMSWASKSFSDCVALLHLYTSWIRKHQQGEFKAFADEKVWAKTYFVQLTSLRDMKRMVDELFKRLQKCGIDFTPSSKTGEEQLLLLKLVIAGGFYPNYFTRPRPNAKDYQKEIARDVVGKDPFSSVVFQGFPMEQPGELYKKIIGRSMRYQNCIPHMEFHGSRVVVTFDSRGSFTGPISTGVYRAVKLRQLRQIVTFGIPSRDVAYKMLNEKKMSLNPDTPPCPSQKPMPDLRTQNIQVVVTHIESPSEFFAVLKSDEQSAILFSQKFDACKRSLFPITREYCELGQLCVVVLRGKYYRGRIDAEKNNCEELLIYMIDRGRSAWYRRNNVFAISKEAIELGAHYGPGLAFQCRLKEVRPALRTDCVWCPEAMAIFENYCNKTNCQVFIEIYGIVNGVVSGTVKNSEDEDCQSVNSILLNKKYADKCAEPQAFQDNYAIRERVKFDLRSDVLSSLKTFEEQQNNTHVPERLMDPPDVGPEPEQVVTLRGPHSPLEMTFTALCGSAHLKQVGTDGNCINSVALDQDPTAPSSRLMIAANVSISQRSGNIIARETTIMPPIPGLTGLLAMLFCPKIEFRTDEDGTCYTGCLTGLGIDPNTGESIYPDHDMEVVFDTVIDNNDVGMVNAIRSGMNSVLSDKITNTEIRNLRDRMRSEAISLLERKRASMEEIWPDQTHEWTVSDESQSKDRKRTLARDAGAVFPLHEQITFTANPDSERSEPRYNRNMFFLMSGENAQG